MVNRTVKTLIVLVVALATLGGSAQAGDILRLYGEDSVGTASGLFMRIPVGARGIALGKAYVACATDGAARR